MRFSKAFSSSESSLLVMHSGFSTSTGFSASAVAGGSTVLRFTNVLPFVPLFAGTVLRGERKCLALHMLPNTYQHRLFA